MGNKQSHGGGAQQLPRLARGELVDVLRQNKWYGGKISEVDAKGTVTVTFTMYGKPKQVRVSKSEHRLKLARFESKSRSEAGGTAGGLGTPAPAPKAPAREKKRGSARQSSGSEPEAENGLVAAVVVDPALAGSSAPMATEAGQEDLSTGTRVDYIDVLDKSQSLEPFDPFGQVMLADSEVPPPPKGGWRWRPAVIESTKGDIATIRFLDEETVPSGFSMVGKVDLLDEYSVAPYQTKSAASTRHHEYELGDPIDVEDHFRKKNSREVVRKWRKCQIVKVSPYYVRVHFVGWSKAFDEWFHVLQQAERLAEFGTHTEAALKRRENREETFVKSLQRDKGLTVVNVDPDGNCLFRAVAHQVYGDVDKHDIVRSDCMDYIVKNRDRFEVLVESGEFDAYIEHKRKLRVWGDDAEVRAMEELYDRPVQIYVVSGEGTNTEPLKIHFDGDLPDEKAMGDYIPIRLSFHGDNHYNSVIPYTSETTSEGGKEVVKDTSKDEWRAPALRLKGVIRKHRRVQVKSRRFSNVAGFAVDTQELHDDDDDEAKDAR